MGRRILENQPAVPIPAADITPLTPALAGFGAEIENAYRPLLAGHQFVLSLFAVFAGLPDVKYQKHGSSRLSASNRQALTIFDFKYPSGASFSCFGHLESS